MTKTAEKVLKSLYNEYMRTKINDFVEISTVSNLPSIANNKAIEELVSLGCIKEDVIGNVQLTDFGISCANH